MRQRSREMTPEESQQIQAKIEELQHKKLSIYVAR